MLNREDGSAYELSLQERGQSPASGTSDEAEIAPRISGIIAFENSRPHIREGEV